METAGEQLRYGIVGYGLMGVEHARNLELLRRRGWYAEALEKQRGRTLNAVDASATTDRVVS